MGKDAAVEGLENSIPMSMKMNHITKTDNGDSQQYAISVNSKFLDMWVGDELLLHSNLIFWVCWLFEFQNSVGLNQVLGTQS